MVYASLISLGQTLEHILQRDDESLRLHKKEQQLIKYLHEKVGFLLTFLDSISPKSSEKVAGFEERIRNAARGAENIIEFQTHLQQMPFEYDQLNQIIPVWLQEEKEELDTILEELVEMKENDEIEILQPSNWLPIASSKSGSTNKTVIVGFDDDVYQVKELLFGWPPTLEIISICGQGGLGKTTLARKIYNDSGTTAYFSIRAWVTVSQEFREQQVLQDILDSTGDLNHESRQHINTDKLAEKVYKRLKHTRFLIVMDDVWNMSALKNIKRLFKRLLPEHNNGSRILLTTRSVMVARLASSHVLPHMLELLSGRECSDLLCHIVFREEHCPPQLEISKEKIIKKCDGLPLATVLIGGLLYKAERTIDYWEYVVTNMRIYADNPMLNILNFCYDQLPYRLRPCFLYMGVLPEDYAIRRSTLTKLWVANGFIKPHKLKSLEDVAEEYLQDLVDRCLIMVREWTHSGQIKTCCTHDLLRDFCLMKAKEAKIDSEAEFLPEVHENLRHVSILTDRIPELSERYDLRVRSVTFFSHNSPSDIHFVTRFWFLRIVNALTLSFNEFPLELVEVITLRYVALTFYLKKRIPASISKLCNLETLIINPGKLRTIFNASFLPPEIWKLSRLRHLLLVRGFLPYPTEALNARNYYILFENLQTLSNIVNFRWTEGVLLRMPNLKKLVISYEHDGRTEWSSYCFDNFDLLHQLEVLKCYFFGKSYMKYQDPLPVKFAFPRNLKRLTLSGCRISWEDMTIVGALPNLQVLKLIFHAFEGSAWEPNEGEFCQLKFLLIHMNDLEHWKASEMHFPSLERLTLNYCYNLVEIPSGIGKIPTLQEINLCGCSASVVTSTKVIQKANRRFGNNAFQVMIKKDDDDTNTSS